MVFIIRVILHCSHPRPCSHWSIFTCVPPILPLFPSNPSLLFSILPCTHPSVYSPNPSALSFHFPISSCFCPLHKLHIFPLLFSSFLSFWVYLILRCHPCFLDSPPLWLCSFHILFVSYISWFHRPSPSSFLSFLKQMNPPLPYFSPAPPILLLMFQLSFLSPFILHSLHILPLPPSHPSVFLFIPPSLCSDFSASPYGDCWVAACSTLQKPGWVHTTSVYFYLPCVCVYVMCPVLALIPT